ncbi:MAG: toprim domain-containing protein [Candidatus Sulfotelmatobacter sp.]
MPDFAPSITRLIDPCLFCASAARNKGLICVVEEATNIQAVEKTRQFNGFYYVLGGALSPLQGIGPEQLMTRFVQGIERRFPEHEHVVMTGGKDSQLIWLVPKLAPDRWHVFSSYPNDRVVSEWLERNDLMPAGGILRHDNQNDETRADTERKVACSDLYSDPRHIKWLPFMRTIAEEHGGRCIFWGGTMSSPAHIYKGHEVEDFSDDPDRMWRSHFERTASWQGNYHQTFFNFVGRPYLSPYHSPEIWNELFVHLDPRAIRWGGDLRDALGQELAGRPVWWTEENPGPEPYSYTFFLNGRTAYRRYVRRLIARERKRRAKGL